MADLLTFDIRADVAWLLAGATAEGLSVVGLAVALSALADRTEA